MSTLTRTPDMSAITDAVRDGKPLPRRDIILWTIGHKTIGFPIYLLDYLRTGDPKDLCRGEGGSSGTWYSRSKGFVFSRSRYVPVTTAGQRELHSVNGCPNCRDRKVQSTPDERREAVKTCKEPVTYVQDEVLKIKWAEVAKFVDPALADQELVDRLKEYMKRRYDHQSQFRPIYGPKDETPEAREIRLAAFDAHQKEYTALEQEGRDLAGEVWDRALGLSIMRAVATGG